MFTRKLLFFTFLLMISVSTSGQVIKMELTQIIDESSAIVNATVEKMHSSWVKDHNGNNIYTTVEFSVNEVIKGNLSNSNFTLKVLGGKVGDISQFVSPSVSFEPKEEVLLFLRNNPLEIIGSEQGKYSIYQNRIYVDEKEVDIKFFEKQIIDYIEKNDKTIFKENTSSVFVHGIENTLAAKKEEENKKSMEGVTITPITITDPLLSTVKQEIMLHGLVKDDQVNNGQNKIVLVTRTKDLPIHNSIQSKIEIEGIKKLVESNSPENKIILSVDTLSSTPNKVLKDKIKRD